MPDDYESLDRMMDFDMPGDEGDTYDEPGCEAIRETEKALLVRRPDGSEVWVPVSQLHDDSEIVAEGDKGTLVVTMWLAEQKGWI